LRVLHLIETLGRGGAEQLLATLLPALKAQGIEPVLGVLKPPLDLLPQFEQSEIPVRQFPGFSKWNLLAGFHHIDALVRSEEIDVVHAHLYFPSLYSALFGARRDVPVVESFHNLAYAGANQGGWKTGLRRSIRSFLLKRGTDRFYGVSQAVANHYREALGLTNVGVIYNAIDLSAIAQAERAQPEGDAKRALQVMVPGRLVHEKGHIDLLDALAGSGLEDFQLTFLGGGPLENKLRAEAAARAIDLSIIPDLPHAELLNLLSGADIVVVPSRFEGFGLTAAEAMALGKSVIATTAGGLPEVVGDAGILVPPNSPAQLSAAIETLAGDAEQRAKLGQMGANRIRSLFDVNVIAAQLANEYRSLVTSDRS